MVPGEGKGTTDAACRVARLDALTVPRLMSDQILFGPFDYLFSHPGKDIRTQLIAGFNAWLKVPEESLAVITKVVGMLHTASLLYVRFFHDEHSDGD